MSDSKETVLRRLIRRIPNHKLRSTLRNWGRLTTEQLRSLDFKQPKRLLTDELLELCQEEGLTTKHITELEMIYVIDNPKLGKWYAYQLQNAKEDAASVGLSAFREQFKAHLGQLIKNVSVKIIKHSDEAIWIRIAWGDNFSRPNHMKPTFVVHHLQTPYVYFTGLASKHKPILNQALVRATRYTSIKDAHLSGTKLSAIRDLLMRQYEQVFPTNFPNPFQENDPPPINPFIQREQAENAEKRQRVACEAFGAGALPCLQTAVYKLETKLRATTNHTISRKDDPFRGVVKFTSSNLLESLRHCVSSGTASTSVTPLLSSITQKGRNYFVIRDKGQNPLSQTPKA